MCVLKTINPYEKSKIMPKIEAIEIAESLIIDSLVTLDDLPKELANTIANVFYKYALLSIEAQEAQDAFPSRILKMDGNNYRERINAYVRAAHSTKIDYEAAINFVRILRNVDKINDFYQYDGIVAFILDCLKYNIKKASNKSRLVRMIERKFKKVDEIPNLIELMSFDVTE